MKSSRIRITHLTFLGPKREPASISFGNGLNVIYGASNTGKSFILDSIDFMFGGRGPLRDIPERVGYDRILLGVETNSGDKFTLQRSTEGGAFLMYEGLHAASVPVGVGVELGEQHSERSKDNLSSLLLSKIGLEGRRVRRNKRNDTQSLSFRNLARLTIVNEEEIIQQRSPLSDGNYTADTANTAVFKLLLTGVDDSALVPTKATGPEEHSREGQLELLDQLIEDMRRQVKELAGPPKEMESQLARLDQTMNQQAEELAISEAQYRDLAGKRRELMKRLDEGGNRLTEIDSLLERFALLDEHYESDLQRLKGIAEAGSLFQALGSTACPLCGALPEHHRVKEDCDGNVDAVVVAAKAEIDKIHLRQGELAQTIMTLEKEATGFRRRLPRIQGDLARLSQQIETMISPSLRQLRRGYGELADKRGSVKEALGLIKTLNDLEDRRTMLKRDEENANSSNAGDVDLSTAVADKFAARVLATLKQWHFPNADRVHFDLKARDLVINGKARVSFGKGLRAVTQAAFTVGLLEYCRAEDTEHPGFVMLDSPLLSYREPESAADDMRGTDLNVHFFDFLAKFAPDRQVIIIENTDPPPEIQKSPQATRFSGVVGTGRFGFFPTEPVAAR